MIELDSIIETKVASVPSSNSRRGVLKKSLWVGVAAIGLAGTAQAAETQKFTYDAKGRLVKVERTGTVNDGVKTDYEYDKANNRKRVKVSGSSGSPP